MAGRSSMARSPSRAEPPWYAAWTRSVRCSPWRERSAAALRDISSARHRTINPIRGGGAGPGSWLCMRVSRVELVLAQRPLAQPEFHRNIVEPAGREAAIEVAHAGNDHA